MRKFKKRWLLILVFISILSASAFNRRYKKVNAEEADITEVIPYKEPSGNANRFLGIWMSNGYSLQPAKDTYVEVNKTKSIYANAGRSWISGLINGPFYPVKHFQWYKSTDGKTWSKVSSKESGTSKTLKFTPTEMGDTYYQLQTYWTNVFGGGNNTPLYSDVATVHAMPGPTDATSVRVTTDDDYLYSDKNTSSTSIVNAETYAHAIPTPEYFTGTVSWSVDNTELATIDEETGLVTANDNGIYGTVTIKARLHNPVGDDIYGYTTIQIGGGLEDQTVKAGKTATFDLRGNIGELDDGEDDDKYSTKWYRVDPITNSPKQILLDQPQALSYTTPETTLDDEGTLFYAIISVEIGGKPYSYITNRAILHVTPEGGPDIEMNNSLKNETFNDGSNTDNMLFGVNNDDVITYKDTVKNNSTTGTLSNATYTLPLKKGTRVTSVKVDGNDVSSDDYTLTDNDQTNSSDLAIKGLEFKIGQSHDIEVSTKVSGVEKEERFATIPYIKGEDDDGTNYQKFGSQISINYTLDSVEITNARDIDFGSLNSISSGGTLSRQAELNLPNNVVDVKDTRRYKEAVKLQVQQIDELTNESTGEALSGHLALYNNGESQSILGAPVIVSQTKDNEELKSIGWDRDNGVLLYMDSRWNTAGKYKTTLNWTIADSV